VLDSVASIKDEAIAVARYVYEHPELGSEESLSSKFIIDVLKRNGFKVENPFLGMDTAFAGTFGSGKHVMVMAEYDALPVGHACGHNLIAAWAVGVALSLKSDRNFAGKLSIVGTPAEEGHGRWASSKVVIGPEMKKRGVEAVFAVHGDDVWAIGGKRYAIAIHRFTFKGVQAHPAIRPELGASALDAAVEFYVSMKMLRSLVRRDEDVILSAVIIDGGKAPNIIPGSAVVGINVRTISARYLEELVDEVKRRAKASASIANCTVEIEPLAQVMMPAARHPSLDSLLFTSLVKYVKVETPDETWAKPPIASTDYGNVSQILPSTHLSMKIAPEGIRPHMAEFKKYADPSQADESLLIAISAACDAIKEFVKSDQ
jgi:amidohydrolase